MKLTAARPLEKLAQAGARPEAAIFFTYTFDPKFFEEQVLRTVLDLGSDPEEQPARFHDEARQALQEIPIACVVDAGVREPGHRLPYDLLEVGSRVFHPKLVVLVFEKVARVSVGSGNLTRGGYGENAETFVVRDFRYDLPEDATVLRQIADFVRGIMAFVRTPGTQLVEALAALERKIAMTPEPSSTSLLFVHSLTSPILEQVKALLPKTAKVTRAGVLAPFFERDDVSATRDDWKSVLGTLVNGAGKDVILDVGVLWDDPPLTGASCRKLDDLADGVGRLWAWSDAKGVEYHVATRVTADEVRTTDAKGVARKFQRAKLEAAASEGDLGLVESIKAYAPAGVLATLAAKTNLSLWLHPSWRHDGERPRHRPLHSKFLLLSFETRAKSKTIVVVGSPNPSRGALLADVARGGNVECAFVFLVDDALALPDVCDELVACPVGLVSLLEREYPAADPDLGAWIESAIHDAEKKTLIVTWASTGPAPLPAWELVYAGQSLAKGEGPSPSPTCIESFELRASACEIDLVVGESRWSVPILVADLTKLPVNTELADLSLRELLALLGQRIGLERLGALRAARGAQNMGTLLEAIFGEGFGPTDVFKAYWAIAEELARTDLSASAFRFRLVGSLSVRSLWLRIDEAARAGSLTREEAWFYGAELLQTFGRIAIPAGTASAEKQAALDTLLAEVRAAVMEFEPAAGNAPWLATVAAHYGLAHAEVVTS